MPSARLLVLLPLLCCFALAQNHVGVPFTRLPVPPVDCAVFAHSNWLARTVVTLPLDSQRSLLEPKTSINPFVQSPNSSQNLISNREAQNRREEPSARCLSLQGSGSNSPALTTRALSSQELAQRDRSGAEVEQLLDGNTCYSIRSYLMARDSKDSDSTHLVGTSTCQPARRYGLKTTDPKPHPLER
jgi:hypothetical protein